jgi:polygalacturonase
MPWADGDSITSNNLNSKSGFGPSLYNVKNATYGALGDGSTEDTTAIQAAIDAAQQFRPL